MEVVPFRPGLEEDVARLILGIQRDEFGIPISAEQQPDLLQIPTFYQVDAGNFWVALAGAEVIGTVALLDIGSSQAALRKMFVNPEFRGPEAGTARLLLGALLAWSSQHAIREIFLGTTASFHAAHRFYQKNGFHEVPMASLPATFPIMEVDTMFFQRSIAPSS